jgi:hypothetical protein
LNKLIADIATVEIGVKEHGNNSGAKIREYQACTTLRPAAWPWCAAFVCWVIDQWLEDPKAVAWLNLKTLTPEKWRPKTALAYGFLQWAKDRPATTEILSDKAKAQAGDIVVYDFSHVGIVIQDKGSRIITVEGNTNGAGSREGDGVYRKDRPKSIARNFIRIVPRQ